MTNEKYEGEHHCPNDTRWLGLVTLVLVVALVVLLIVVWKYDNVNNQLTEYKQNHSAHVLQEDDPGWDCKTMGNHICGPVSLEPDPADPEHTDVLDGTGKLLAIVRPEANHSCHVDVNMTQPDGKELICQP